MLTREQFQFCILLLAVPAQYLVVQYMGSNEVSRTYAINNMVNEFHKVKHDWLNQENWGQWCRSVLNKLIVRTLDIHGNLKFIYDNPGGKIHDDGDRGESPALEVMKHREKMKEGHFSQSAEPRNPKNPEVKFRVGQVIKHKKWGYNGVIIGWDETAKAPKDWIKRNHGENKHWKRQPNYSILVDTRDRQTPQITYVPQENIDIVQHFQVIHPNVDDYFESFDGSQYIPRPWLKWLYPKD